MAPFLGQFSRQFKDVYDLLRFMCFGRFTQLLRDQILRINCSFLINVRFESIRADAISRFVEPSTFKSVTLDSVSSFNLPSNTRICDFHLRHRHGDTRLESFVLRFRHCRLNNEATPPDLEIVRLAMHEHTPLLRPGGAVIVEANRGIKTRQHSPKLWH